MEELYVGLNASFHLAFKGHNRGDWMPDQDKVIKGLECCASMNGGACRECPYSSECVASEVLYQTGTAHLAADALALLKEQEALPIVYRENQFTGLPVAHCPSCDECLLQFHAGAYGKETKFCYYCGQAVKWE